MHFVHIAHGHLRDSACIAALVSAKNKALNIKNTGTMDSDEVPQVYLGAPSVAPDGVQFPIRALAAFDRVHIPAGASKAVTLHIAPRQLQFWSTKDDKWVTASGKRTVSVGGSSRNLRLTQETD